jgi:hypothetical protein
MNLNVKHVKVKFARHWVGATANQVLELMANKQ